MKLWFIKHVPTGHYIPEPIGRNRRGGSHLEPSPISDNARIFRSERSAKIFLSTWLKGKVHCHRYGSNYYGDEWYDEELRVVPVVSRIREDMEIIEKEIIL